MLKTDDQKQLITIGRFKELPTRPLTQAMTRDKDVFSTLTGWFVLSEQVNFQGFDFYAHPSQKVYIHLQNGIVHKSDGPAIKYEKDENGFLFKYIINGKLHRENGPAIVRYAIDCDGFDGENFIIDESLPKIFYVWYHKGMKHRLDGHAYMSNLSQKDQAYYYLGDKILKRDFIKLPAVIEACRKKEIKESLRKSFDPQK